MRRASLIAFLLATSPEFVHARQLPTHTGICSREALNRGNKVGTPSFIAAEWACLRRNGWAEQEMREELANPPAECNDGCE